MEKGKNGGDSHPFLTVAVAAEILFKLYKDVINKLPKVNVTSPADTVGGAKEDICAPLDNINEVMCAKYGIKRKAQKWAVSNSILGLTKIGNVFLWNPKQGITKGYFLPGFKVKIPFWSLMPESSLKM